MKKLVISILILSTTLVHTACFQQKDKQLVTAASQNGFHISFAEENLAKELLTQDKVEGFFETIQILDAAIQMQRPVAELDASSYVQEYKQFIAEQVLAFSKSDKQKMQSIFSDIQSTLKTIQIDLGLDEIVLIKTTGGGYGKQAYYTRENTIVIPESQLENTSEELRTVMLHELFHIYSRYNTKAKEEIYKMIGFQPMSSDPVVDDPVLAQRLLLNPDGLATNSYITLSNGKGGEMQAVPLIYSTYDDYKPNVKDYFTYLKFDLYRLVEKDGKKIVLSNGVSTDVDATYFNSFFESIADNTQYIIHPDEIMADNFMLMVNAYALNDFSRYSEKGKALIEKLYAYLSDK